MSQNTFRNWRGYLYVAAGVSFGIYKGLKVEQWTPWDLVDQLIAMAMIAVGVFLIVKK